MIIWMLNETLHDTAYFARNKNDCHVLSRPEFFILRTVCEKELDSD
jgi:hypothetical protein